MYFQTPNQVVAGQKEEETSQPFIDGIEAESGVQTLVVASEDGSDVLLQTGTGSRWDFVRGDGGCSLTRQLIQVHGLLSSRRQERRHSGLFVAVTC